MALPSPPGPPQAGLPALIGRLGPVMAGAGGLMRQPAVRRALPSVLVLGVLLLAGAVWLGLRQPALGTLYPGLPDAEKARVVEVLDGAGIAVSVNGTTGEVEVPRADVYRARMALAAQGLPQSAPTADSALGALQMGASRSVEAVRLRQAQELELARSITEIAGIGAARVHLALPERSAFLRDTQPPGASVLLDLLPGRVLDPGQVEAIVNLVAASVPGMARGQVAVVDQRGNLLSRAGDDPAALAGDRQLQQRLHLEQLYRNLVEALLTPLTGPGNLSVQVTIDMDFTHTEITEERMDPQGSVLRSEQVQQSETAGTQARGIPGAVSNTPPADAKLTAKDAGADAAPEGPTTRSTGTTRNYEVSRTVQTTRPATGRITRLTAAVLVRALPGETPEATALAPAALADMERLVRGAIGFDAARGDSLTILAQPFIEPAAPEVPGVAPGLDWLPDVARQLALVAVLAIVALGVVRPLLTRLMAPPAVSPAPSEVASPAEAPADLRNRLEERRLQLADQTQRAGSRDEKFALLRQMAEDDPARIAAVLRRMMRDEIEKVM